MNYEKIENILEVYSLQEIIEHNDLSDADVLFFLIQQKFLELPEPEPL